MLAIITQKGLNCHRGICPKEADWMANSVDADQIAPFRAVLLKDLFLLKTLIPYGNLGFITDRSLAGPDPEMLLPGELKAVVLSREAKGGGERMRGGKSPLIRVSGNFLKSMYLRAHFNPF